MTIFAFFLLSLLIGLLHFDAATHLPGRLVADSAARISLATATLDDLSLTRLTKLDDLNEAHFSHTCCAIILLLQSG